MYDINIVNKRILVRGFSRFSNLRPPETMKNRAYGIYEEFLLASVLTVSFSDASNYMLCTRIP